MGKCTITAAHHYDEAVHSAGHSVMANVGARAVTDPSRRCCVAGRVQGSRTKSCSIALLRARTTQAS